MGTALGTLVVTTLLDLPWPVRLVLVAVVVVAGLGYVLWRHRRDVGRAPGGDEPTGPTEPATPPDPTASPAPPAAPET
ncbi:MAG: hypothetical protein JF622_06120 [Terrabacter sp.]|nr:hypothetical protein [Terrabacter sp.]